MEYTSQFMFLLGAALNEKKVQLPIPLDVDGLFSMAVRHSLECGMGLYLKNNGMELPSLWQKAINGVLYKKAQMQYETERFFSWLEREKIWYMPLKGWIIQDAWPTEFVRQMGDVDLLADPSKARQIREHLESRGYETLSFSGDFHDSYFKKPVFHYEIHPCLVPKGAKGYNYYRNIKERIHRMPNKQYEYGFSPEDFLIFLLVHMHKHWRNGGSGFRGLADVYVWRRKHPEIKQDYLDRELTTLGLFEFGYDIMALAEKLFAEPSLSYELTEKERKMISFMEDGGTYGSLENIIEHTENKWVYLLRRIFPPISFFREKYYHFVPVFLPAFWIYWVLRNILLNFEQVKVFFGSLIMKKR